MTYDWLLASNGSGYVIKIANGVFALVPINGGRCQFSFSPGSFYKFGYFLDCKDETNLDMLSDLLKTLRKNIEDLDKQNEWKCCSVVTISDVKAAWEIMSERDEVKKLLDD